MEKINKLKLIKVWKIVFWSPVLIFSIYIFNLFQTIKEMKINESSISTITEQAMSNLLIIFLIYVVTYMLVSVYTFKILNMNMKKYNILNILGILLGAPLIIIYKDINKIKNEIDKL